MNETTNILTTKPADNSILELPDAALIQACEQYCQHEAKLRAFFQDGETPIENDAARILAQAPHRLAQAVLMADIIELRATTLEGARARARAALAWDGPEGDDEPGYEGEVAEVIACMLRDLVDASPNATA